jgi:hypothetical protein
MAKKRQIQLFRTGKHTDAAGNPHEFSADQVGAIAASFDPKIAPAPVCVGHPTTDAPAYGWVESLAFNASTGMLDAGLDLHDDMEKAVQDKHFNRVSAAFFAPDSPANPKPGSFYLRHVGFLGAAAPAVTGLKPFGFSDTGEAHTFKDADKPGGLFTVEFSVDGTKSISEQLLDGLAALVAKVKNEPAPSGYRFSFDPNFTAPAASGATTMNDADKAKMTALETENAKLKADAEKATRDAYTAAATQFADKLITDKKINPSEKPEIVATYCAMAIMTPVEFANTDGTTVKKSPLDSFKSSLEARGTVISTTEKTPPDGERKNAGAKAVGFAAPSGLSVDSDAAEVNNKAKVLMSKDPKLTYAAAVDLVVAGNTV